ncbi:MAG: type I 3-dehydroquinate dehydratase [Ignisphaera sp.]|uniref:3-dehydroquinate dehydratase n=1 Tax=Ignisphaera aggregans TaxID=334771 RepID=A0A7C4NK16_9CREN
MSNNVMLVASIPIGTAEDLGKVLKIEGVDLIELRVDYSDNPLAIDFSLVKDLPVIVTLRDAYEGGVKEHKDEVKLKLLSKLSKLGIMYDLEMKFVEKYGINYENNIVSMHILNTRGVDKEIIKSKVKKFSGKAFAVKIATRPFPGYRTFLVELLELGNNIAVMPMDVDPVERIAFALLGSKLLYCYTDKPTASGQPSCTEASKVLSLVLNLRRRSNEYLL